MCCLIYILSFCRFYFLPCNDLPLSQTSFSFSVYENEQVREREVLWGKINVFFYNECVSVYVYYICLGGDHSWVFLCIIFFLSHVTSGYVYFLIFSVFMLTDDLTVNISVKYISSTPVIKCYRLPCTCDTILEWSSSFDIMQIGRVHVA